MSESDSEYENLSDDEAEDGSSFEELPRTTARRIHTTRPPDMTRKDQDLELLVLRKPNRNDKMGLYVPKPSEALPTNPLPQWRFLRLDEKVPLVPAPRGTFVNFRGELSKPLYVENASEFDILDPQMRETRTDYVALHDPHLKYYFQTQPILFKRLIDTGLLTENGEVICSLAELNRHRVYLGRVHRLQVTAERHKQDEWENCQRKHVKAVEAAIKRELRRQRSDLRFLRRLKIVQENERRISFLRLKWKEASNTFAERRAKDQAIAKKIREMKRHHVARRLLSLRETQQKKIKRIILHIVCEEDFSAKLRAFLCAQKLVNHEADLKSFTENKRRYQEDKLRYHRALLRRDTVEKKCRVENRKRYYAVLAEKQAEFDKQKVLRAKAKAERELYLMRKYGYHWRNITLRSHQEGFHQSIWHVRNSLQEENRNLRELTKREGLADVLGTLFIGKKSFKGADEGAIDAGQEPLSTAYGEFVENLTKCVVNYVVDEAGKRILDYICREGIDPKDLQKPIIPIRKRNQIHLEPPHRPCSGPCAQFGRGDDWALKCGKMTQELYNLRQELKKTIKKKLIKKLPPHIKGDENWKKLKDNVSKVESDTDINTAIDTVAGITMDRVSPNPANPQMQKEFKEYATTKIVKSLTSGLTESAQPEPEYKVKRSRPEVAPEMQKQSAGPSPIRDQIAADPVPRKRSTLPSKTMPSDTVETRSGVHASPKLSEEKVPLSQEKEIPVTETSEKESPKKTENDTEKKSIPAEKPVVNEATELIPVDEKISPVATPDKQNTPVAAPEKKTGPVETPIKKTSPVAIVEKLTSPVDTSEKKISPVATPEQRTSPVATPEQRTSPVETPMKKTSPVAIVEKQASPVENSEEKITPVATPEQRTSPVEPSEKKITPVQTSVKKISPVATPVKVSPTATPQKKTSPSATPGKKTSPAGTPDKKISPAATPVKEISPVASPERKTSPASTLGKKTSQISPASTPVKEVSVAEAPERKTSPVLTPEKPISPAVTPKEKTSPAATPDQKISAAATSVEEVSPAIPVKTVSPAATPLEEVSPVATPLKEVSPAVTQLKEVSPAPTPVKEVSPAPTPVKEVSPAATPAKEVSPAVTPVTEVSPAATPVKEVSPAVTPVEEVSPAATPDKKLSPISIPVKVSPAATPERKTSPAAIPDDKVSPAATPVKEVSPAATPERKTSAASTPEKKISPAGTPQRRISLIQSLVEKRTSPTKTSIEEPETEVVVQETDEERQPQLSETEVPALGTNLSEGLTGVDQETIFGQPVSQEPSSEIPVEQVILEEYEIEHPQEAIQEEPIPEDEDAKEQEDVGEEIEKGDLLEEPITTFSDAPTTDGFTPEVDSEKEEQGTISPATKLTAEEVSSLELDSVASQIPGKTPSGDWSECVSQRASDIVQAALCAACGKMHEAASTTSICDDSLNVDSIADDMTRRALADVSVLRSKTPKLTTSICDDSLNVDSIASDIARRALAQACAAARTDTVCDDSMNIDFVASEIAKRSLAQACAAARGDDSPSAQWSTCVSAKASSLVRDAICAACGQIHGGTQGPTPPAGISDQTEIVESVATHMKDKALRQVDASSKPTATKPHVRIIPGETLRDTKVTEPRRTPSAETVNIRILSETSLGPSTAQILVAPRLLPTQSELTRDLTPSEFQDMTYHFDPSTTTVKSMVRAKGKLDVHEGQTGAVPSLMASGVDLDSQVLLQAPGTSCPPGFRRPGQVFPAEVRSEVQAQLRLIRAEVDQLTRTLRDAGVLPKPPA